LLTKWSTKFNLNVKIYHSTVDCAQRLIGAATERHHPIESSQI
jgi:hypothetical protein